MQSKKDMALAKFHHYVDRNGGTIIVGYTNSRSKVTIRCANGHEFTTLAKSILGGHWCKTCAGKDIRTAEENFHKNIAKLGGRVLGKYSYNSTPVLVCCKFGHEFTIRPNSIMYDRHWCTICSGYNSDLLKARFQTKVNAKGGKIISEYINTKSDIRLLCNRGHEFITQPSRVLHQQQWCPTCSGHDPRELTMRCLKRIVKHNGTLLTPFIRNDDCIIIRCEKGHYWHTMPRVVGCKTLSPWCPACSGHCPLESQKRLQAVVARKGGKILEPYITMDVKIGFQCSKGHIWRTRPNTILCSDAWCPSCKRSKGEELIMNILTKLNVAFVTEFPVVGRKWRYDFALTYNGRNIIIEFDGEQHFGVSYFSKTHVILQHRQSVDVEKTKLALSSGYRMIRFHHSFLEESYPEKILWEALNSAEPLLCYGFEHYSWLTLNFTY